MIATKVSRLIKVFGLIFGLSFVMCFSLALYFSTRIQLPKILEVPQGSIKGIIAHLNQITPKQFSRIDEFFLRAFGNPQSGFIELQCSDLGGFFDVSFGCDAQSQEEFITLNRLDFLLKLSSAKAAQRQITLIPGETLYFFIQNASQKFNFDSTKLQSAYNKYFHLPDGIIVPETYSLPLLQSEDEFMQLLSEISYKWHKARAIELLGEYDEDKWFYFVSMAAIVQKEAANIDEMPIVAGVVHNRLNKDMPLQMDGALNYGEFSHTKITPKRIKEDTNPCNTYKYKGIPPYPCASASLDSIKASFNPANVEYLYFVRNKNGTHTFSKTYEEHRSNF